MKKIIIALFITCLVLTGCKKEEEIPKSSLKEENGVYSVVLNGKELTLTFKEEVTKKNKKQVTVLLNDEDIMKYTRYYDGKNLYDDLKVALVKGTDKKSYLAFALGNWTGSKFNQYLYIMNDEGKVIYHIDDTKFGAAFLDYSNIEELTSMYGDTGMVKIEEDKITYLRDFNYTPDEEFVRLQENIITIDNSEITETKGNIIKAAKVA